MTGALDAVLDYAQRGWPAFPCHWHGERRKRPLVVNGLHAATRDEAQIRQWWQRWSSAPIGVPTGKASGFIVLDDRNHPDHHKLYVQTYLRRFGAREVEATELVIRPTEGRMLRAGGGG